MDTKQLIWFCTGSHEHYTIDGNWSTALGCIKREVPPLTAVVAVEGTQYAIVENAQACVIWIFLENALLGKFEVKKDESETKRSENF